MAMSETIEHFHSSSPSPEPFKVKVERGQKGGYGWEIAISGDSLTHILDLIEAADRRLRETYSPAGPEEVV